MPSTKNRRRRRRSIFLRESLSSGKNDGSGKGTRKWSTCNAGITLRMNCLK